MSNLKERTVADIVTEDIATATVFKRNGIDFCCGGKVKLEEICNRKDIDTASVEKQLNEVLSGVKAKEDFDPDSMSLGHLIGHIESTHHSYISSSTPIILEFSDKVREVHGQSAPEVIEMNDLAHALLNELTSHMMKEERVLFPYIRTLEQAADEGTVPQCPFGSVCNPIDMMESEHESAGEMMSKIHELTNNYEPPEWACNTFKALYHSLQEFENDLHIHIHLENNILFPKAVALEAELTKAS